MRLFLCGLALATAATATPARAETYDHCTGFVDTVPATIIGDGVWCLRKDLSTPITSGGALTLVGFGAITLDCNGFAIRGTGGAASTADGVYGFGGNGVQAQVRNCRVQGFGTGIMMLGSVNRIFDNVVDGNYYQGIFVNGPADIAGNRVSRTGGSTVRSDGIGINFGYNATVRDNVVDGVRGGTNPNLARGIGTHASGEARVIGNRVRNVAGTSGIGIDAATAITAVVDGNHVGGVATGVRCADIGVLMHGNTFAGIAGDVTLLCPPADNLVIE